MPRTKLQNLLAQLENVENALESASWVLSRQPRALQTALDLYYKLLKFGWKRNSFQKDRQGTSWAAKRRIQVGEYHLGSPCFAFPILLKLFPKATKLGTLFPKVKTNLSMQTAGRLQVRAEKYWPFCMQTYGFECKMDICQARSNLKWASDDGDPCCLQATKEWIYNRKDNMSFTNVLWHRQFWGNSSDNTWSVI